MLAHCAKRQFGLRETNRDPLKRSNPWRSTNNWGIIRTLFSSIHYSPAHFPPAHPSIPCSRCRDGRHDDVWFCLQQQQRAVRDTHTATGSGAADSSNRHERGRVFPAPLRKAALDKCITVFESKACSLRQPFVYIRREEFKGKTAC